jgi:gamma-glutamyltranspeptidase/glutathione hydrolase
VSLSRSASSFAADSSGQDVVVQFDRTVTAPRGIVCTVDQLASAAGVALLRDGGSAADAAVAASAVLAVTTQHMCGMGGDLVAVVHPGRGQGRPEALLAIGRAGAGADPAGLRAEGHQHIPFRDDIRAVTVPGCVDGWLALHARFGRRPLADVLAPAASYAEHGFPVSPLLAASLPHVADVAGVDDYVVGGLPHPGELRRRPGVARSLHAIAERGRDAWYGGEFGAGLLRLGNGWFAPSDLERDLAQWEPTVSLRALGLDVHATPPPTQGYLTLAGAAVADQLPLPADTADALWPHLLIEAARAVGHDRNSRLYDGADPAMLLDAADLKLRASHISTDRAGVLDTAGTPGGTIYLSAADADGMAVSLSQSNAAGFGAYIVVPEVGVFLQNRGIGFSLRADSPAVLAPGKRPIHTLAPLIGTDDAGNVTVVTGTMGGDAQPQVCLQLLARHRSGATPHDAVDAARWALAGVEGTGFDTWSPGSDGQLRQVVRIEDTAPNDWDAGLRERGHTVERIPKSGAFGHAQLAVVRPDGVLAGAADPRAFTGAAAGC